MQGEGWLLWLRSYLLFAENWGKPAENLKETSLQVVGNLSLEIPGEGFE